MNNTQLVPYDYSRHNVVWWYVYCIIFLIISYYIIKYIFQYFDIDEGNYIYVYALFAIVIVVYLTFDKYQIEKFNSVDMKIFKQKIRNARQIFKQDDIDKYYDHLL
jgi:hypothetical protein